MPPKNSGGSTKFPGGHKVIHRTAQTAFVRVVTPHYLILLFNFSTNNAKNEYKYLMVFVLQKTGLTGFNLQMSHMAENAWVFSKENNEIGA